MEKICPKCGASSSKKEFIGNFCVSCAPFPARAPSEISFMQCKRCGKVDYAGWSEPSPVVFCKLILRECTGLFTGGSFDPKKSEIALEAYSKAGKISKAFHVFLSPGSCMCPECNKALGSYSEAIIQLRGRPGKVEKYAGLLGKRISRKSFVSREERLKEGVNLYIGSREEAEGALKFYGLDSLRTQKLVGQKRDGKKIYRLTFRVRL